MLRKHWVEKINNKLYDSQSNVNLVLTVVEFLASVAGAGVLVFGFGYKETSAEAEKLTEALDVVFGVFVAVFFLRVFYSLKAWTYIKENKFETFLITLILTNVITNYLFDSFLVRTVFDLLKLSDFKGFYIFSESVYILTIVGYKLVVASMSIPRLNIRPPTLFILSFGILILCGAGLLMLPTMTVHPGSMSFTDALFTSASATCVTGLIVVDTATYFTIRGQVVILILIQVGGLGLLAFALFFAQFIRKNVSLKEQVLIQDFFSSDSLYSAKRILRQVVTLTLGIEAISAVLIYYSWGNGVEFISTGQKVYFSVFHAISAFCNAGFSLFSNNLFESSIRHAYLMQVVVAVTVIFGGLGFTVIEDLFSPKKLRERLRKPWMDWRLSTKVAVYVSAFLIVLGTVIIFILEFDNTMDTLNVGEKMVASFFQSVVARTAGFNSVDIGGMRNATLIFVVVLMFIGASSGSVGGGIKTSTFYLISVSALATIRGKSRIEIGKREIPKTLLFKALSVFFFASTIIMISLFLLAFFEPEISVIHLAFEEVSAFATVGLSTGITSALSEPSKYILIISMFLGRVGTLTFVLSLSNSAYTKTYKYPSTSMMVG
ncbi:potassium transporter [Fulvitalea axinellae]|uniref:Potassium transporter n=1 Tax=Fulvitalea axinellae TaxID=1182444 RepID=A0AAU9C784_9BACT|nr:potassium transporter [Fulvitalea axinellae]